MSDELIEQLIADSDGRWHDSEFRIDAQDLTALLRAALAKREAVTVELPAALVVTAEGSRHDYYAEGWNDCRRKVRELAASQQAAKGEGT